MSKVGCKLEYVAEQFEETLCYRVDKDEVCKLNVIMLYRVCFLELINHIEDFLEWRLKPFKAASHPSLSCQIVRIPSL